MAELFADVPELATVDHAPRIPFVLVRVLVEMVPVTVVLSIRSVAPAPRVNVVGFTARVDPVPDFQSCLPVERVRLLEMVFDPLVTALASMPLVPRVRVFPEIE